MGEIIVASEATTEVESTNYDGLLKQYFGKDWKTAQRIMLCESGANPSAIGDKNLMYWQGGHHYGSSAGLFQVRDLPGRPQQAWLLISVHNVAYAAQLYHAHGWQPWTCAVKLGIIK